MKRLHQTAIASLFALLFFNGSEVFAQQPSTTPQSGCLSGYPNGTYRGNQRITRNEFAAGLNTCLDQVNRSLQFNRADYATRADFQRLIDRQRQLNDQLRGLSGQVDRLDGGCTTGTCPNPR